MLNKEERLKLSPSQGEFEEILENIATLRAQKVNKYGEDRYQEHTLEFDLKMAFSDVYRKYIRLEKAIWQIPLEEIDLAQVVEDSRDLGVYSLTNIQLLQKRVRPRLKEKKFALVTGAGSGLGLELSKALFAREFEVLGLDKTPPKDTKIFHRFDIGDVRRSLKAYASTLSSLDVLINCAGVNRICKTEDLTDEVWNGIMDVNVRGIVNCVQATLGLLKRSKGTIVNICSNAADVPLSDSLAYNASKGAVKIMTRQMARDFTYKQRTGITVFGISPAKMKNTGMSKQIDEMVREMRGWPMEKVQEYQRQSLVTGKETDPKAIAEVLAFMLEKKERHEFLSGCILEFGK